MASRAGYLRRVDRDTGEELGEEHEEFERIPWAELLPAGRGPNRLLYLAAGVLGAVALGVILARAWPHSSGPVETTSTSVEEVPVAATTTPSPPQVPALYSEADLMAFPVESDELAAVARAEWFVVDYFTVDGLSGSVDIRNALPVQAEVAGLPQDGSGVAVMVDWARAFRIEAIDDGLYEVSVAFRLIVPTEESGDRRLPVRAVAVRVSLGLDEGSAVVDLPTPISLPAGPEPDPWPEGGDDPPEEVAAGAAEAVGGWGTEPRIVAAQRIESGWRVVMTSADEVGNRWPVVVWVDDEGRPLQH